MTFSAESPPRSPPTPEPSGSPAAPGSPGTIDVANLTKDFGTVRAVDNLTFTVQPGRVTGFLGPNGAGKTTTLRMLLGLVRPSVGTATISGKLYAEIEEPLRTVGAALEAASFHPGRKAYDHLRSFAPAAGADDARCQELLDLVGLTDAANRRVGGFSLGMRQRLALATTLLGDPRVLLLDEPANGLDPAGIVWLRGLLRHLASEGRTVLVSSHMLSEIQQSVDDVIIISGGRLVHASTLSELTELAAPTVSLVSPDTAGLETLVQRERWQLAEPMRVPGRVLLTDVSVARVGAASFSAGLEVHELSTHGGNLESLFLDLVAQGDPSQQPGAHTSPPDPASEHSEPGPTPSSGALDQGGAL